MSEDKIIKTGQLTLPRLIFLAAAGALIAGTVALGDVWLTIGYWLLTLALCIPLLLIAIDYRVDLANTGRQALTPQNKEIGSVPTDSVEVGKVVRDARPKRRSGRPAKRRR